MRRDHALIARRIAAGRPERFRALTMFQKFECADCLKKFSCQKKQNFFLYDLSPGSTTTEMLDDQP
jgi:hypothetical protein